MNDAQARTNIIILDACRDNPFKAVTRGLERGLAVIGRKPPESIIVYATAENEKAEDGTGRNGVFTGALLRHIERREAFTDVLLDVKAQVRSETSDKQKPANYDNLTRKVYLAGVPAAPVKPEAPAKPAAPAAAEIARAAEDLKRGLDAYYRGGTKEDYAEALKRFRLAADAGSGRAQFQLGTMYIFGRGVKHDMKEALAWFERAAESGLALAQWYIGAIYEDGGDGVQKNHAEAEKWFRRANDQLPALRRAADEGDREAVLVFVLMYSNGFGARKDAEEAKKWNLRLLDLQRDEAVRGILSAQISLGLVYRYGGEYVAQDFAEALKWYRKAAEQGSEEAEYTVGEFYHEGLGVTKDFKEALRWWKRSAEHGYEYAQYALGSLYVEGRETKKNVAEGLKWYRKAADQGMVSAQLALGNYYSDESNKAKDLAEAFLWYRKAAEQEDVTAQFFIAEMFREGRGTAQDPAEAVKWYVKAAEQGNPNAQDSLGEMYEKGEGVTQDYVLAHMWYNVETISWGSVTEFRDKAAKQRDAIAKKMTPQQIAEAQKLAREWREKHSK